jgi:IS30 family transposase
MRLEGREDYICHETIYSYIYSNGVAKKEEWRQYLRYGHRKRRKQTGRGVHRSKIPNRVSIHLRPEIVNKREEYGHWEADSVIYPNKYAVHTMNELKTGYLAFRKLERKTAGLTGVAMLDIIQEYGAKTITVDNGSEFTLHEQVTESSGVSIYFCDPYSSWQRGSNENGNMLLRGFLPKRTDISKLKQEELDEIACELNNRPRKRLGWLTPAEAYMSEVYLSKINRENNCT